MPKLESHESMSDVTYGDNLWHYHWFEQSRLVFYYWSKIILVSMNQFLHPKIKIGCHQVLILHSLYLWKTRFLYLNIFFRYILAISLTCNPLDLTPRPLAHISFTYRKLNMDVFSVLNGFLGCVDSTQKIFLKFFHAQGLFQTSWFTS